MNEQQTEARKEAFAQAAHNEYMKRTARDMSFEAQQRDNYQVADWADGIRGDEFATLAGARQAGEYEAENALNDEEEAE